MSYDLQVLRDNPIGYWSLNNTNKDVTKYANAATISGTYVSPPIIANGGYSLKVTNSTTATIANTNGLYECFAKNYDARTFTIGFWFDINNQLNGSGAGTYANNQLVLLSIKNGATVIAKIVYDYKSNTIRYNFPGTNNTDAYIVLKDLDKQYYVVATYSNKSISISVNAKEGIAGYVSDTTNIIAATKTGLSFVVSDSNIPANSSFLISSLEFYNYQLSGEQVQRHILWAGNDEKPNFQGTISSSTSLFAFFEDPNLLGFSRTISDLDFSNNGQLKNLRVRNDGISALQLDSPIFNSFYDPTSTYTINTSSGINWSGYGGVDIPFLSDYLNMNTGFTAYMTINRTSTGSYNEYLFGITNVNGDFLYLEYDVPDGNTNYYLRSYNPYTDITTSLISLSGGKLAASAKVSNVAVQFSSSAVVLYSSDSVGATASLAYESASSFMPFYLDKSSTMTIGNSYHSNKTLSSYISNFGLTDEIISSPSATPFGSLSTFLLPMTDSTNPFLVKQRGYWIYQIPSVTIPMSTYYGTIFDWSTMDNCQVFYSIDSGNTYNLINRYDSASLYNTLGVPQNISIKVQIDTDYKIDAEYQSFNNFYYNIYDYMQINSDGDSYQLTSTTSSANPNLSISNGTNNILARQDNFGIKFTGASPTNALITVPAGISYYAVDFWYRPDFLQSGSSNYILNNASSSATAPAIWTSSTSNFQSLGGILYVNGASVVDNTLSASAGEIYHIALVLSASNNSNLYLNGGSLGSRAKRSNSTYGYIQFWNNTPAPADINDRYTQFFGKTTFAITDTNATKLYSTSSKDSYLITQIG